MTGKLTTNKKIKLNTLANVRSEMSRLYRLWLGKNLEADSMTKAVYTLKEIRGCIEGEILTDIQKRLANLAEAGRG
jgi:hypothetical protein